MTQRGTMLGLPMCFTHLLLLKASKKKQGTNTTCRRKRAVRLAQEQCTRKCNHMAQSQAKLNSVLLSFSYLPGNRWDQPEAKVAFSFSSISVFNHKGVWTIHVWLVLYCTLHLIRQSNYIKNGSNNNNNNTSINNNKYNNNRCQSSITPRWIDFFPPLLNQVGPTEMHWPLFQGKLGQNSSLRYINWM